MGAGRRVAWWWAMAPAAVGVAAALVVWWRFPRADLVTRTPLAVAALMTGVVLTLVVVALLWHRRSVTLAAERARASQEEAARAEHQRFVQRLDHELKNPLAAISLGLTNLQGSEHADTAVLEGLQGQVGRLSRLVAELRRLNELRAEVLEYEELDLGEVVEEAVLGVQDLPQLQGRAFQVQLRRQPWPLGPVRADRDLVSLAVYNVLLNAAKYSADEAGIDVSVHGEDDAVTVEVSDSGIGIPEGDLPVIWQELSRAANARHVSGSGLGLAMVRAVVELHGGTVQARSQQDVGTRVVLTLPRR